MSKFLLIPLLLFTAFVSYAQLDTTYLKNIVSNISTEKDHIDFWKFIEHRDQDLMRSTNKELIDKENLIMVSYYLNRFEYPDKNVLGAESSILNLVWLHTTSYEVKKLTFPILLQAYEAQFMSKEYLLKGFAQASYHRMYDDNDYLTKPLGTIFQELSFNVGDKIDVPLVVKKLEEFNAFLEQEKMIVGIGKLPRLNEPIQ